MKKFAFIALSVLFLSGCGPTRQLVTSSKKYEDKFKDRLEEGATLLEAGYNYTRERTADNRFLYKEFYPTTGQMTRRITYGDPGFKVKQGLSVDRYDNGFLWKQGRYVDDQMEGMWQYYNPKDGTLQEYGNYEGGKREGSWTRIDSSEALLSVYQYEDGQLHGPFKIYRPAGVLFKEGVYQKGELRLEKVVGEDVASSTAIAIPEVFPYMSGCQNADPDEQKSCSDLKMLTAVYKNIKYPALARERGIQGTAIINFVVKKDGSMEEVEVLRGLCDEIKAECLRVMALMPPWEPGMQSGEPVNVLFMLPIKFKLE